MQNSELISVSQAAERLRVHPDTLRRWAKRGIFKVTRISNKPYLQVSEMRAFLEGRLSAPASSEPATQAIIGALDEAQLDQLIAIPKAAQYLGVHFMTVYRWIKAGQLKPVKVGWQMYLTIDDVETIKARLDAQVENH